MRFYFEPDYADEGMTIAAPDMATALFRFRLFMLMASTSDNYAEESLPSGHVRVTYRGRAWRVYGVAA